MRGAGNVYRHDDEDVATHHVPDIVGIDLPPLRVAIERFEATMLFICQSNRKRSDSNLLQKEVRRQNSQATKLQLCRLQITQIAGHDEIRATSHRQLNQVIVGFVPQVGTPQIKNAPLVLLEHRFYSSYSFREKAMAGKSLSAYVSDEVAASLALEAAREGRTTAQVAGQAIRLFVSLPREARASLAALDGLANSDERRWMLNEVARLLNMAEFAMTERRMAEQLRGAVPANASDEELDRIALEWTQADRALAPTDGR